MVPPDDPAPVAVAAGRAGRRATVLAAVRADATFARVSLKEGEAYVGRCLHCRAKLVVYIDGQTPANTTLEHIVPQHHGGGDALDNLALACRRCNHLKGSRIDVLPPGDPAYRRTVDRLLAERRRREPS